jgi:hypothetical protein
VAFGGAFEAKWPIRIRTLFIVKNRKLHLFSNVPLDIPLLSLVFPCIISCGMYHTPLVTFIWSIFSPKQPLCSSLQPKIHQFQNSVEKIKNLVPYSQPSVQFHYVNINISIVPCIDWILLHQVLEQMHY